MSHLDLAALRKPWFMQEMTKGNPRHFRLQNGIAPLRSYAIRLRNPAESEIPRFKPFHSSSESVPAPLPWSVASQEQRERQPQLLSASLTLTEFREITDDDLQLIEMHYQQMLALMDLELLFADGQLDCM
jgi:hypothetical protein